MNIFHKRFPHLVNTPWRGGSGSKWTDLMSDPPAKRVPTGVKRVSQYDSWGNGDPLLF